MRAATSVAVVLGLALAGVPVRAAEPVEAAPAPETTPTPAPEPTPEPTLDLTAPVATTGPGATAPVATTEPVAPAPTTADDEPRRPGDRMVQAGVGITIVGLLAYGLAAAGLSIGSRAEGELQPLTDRDDIDARRDVLARGRLGNRLAIAGAITATASLAVGIPLIVVGRRRHEASLRASVSVEGLADGVGIRLLGRF